MKNFEILQKYYYTLKLFFVYEEGEWVIIKHKSHLYLYHIDSSGTSDSKESHIPDDNFHEYRNPLKRCRHCDKLPPPHVINLYKLMQLAEAIM